MTLDETIKRFEALAKSYESYVENINPKELAEWLTELKETRKLLKQAVEAFSKMDSHIYSCDRLCDDCPLSGERDHCLKWRYTDEALKLIKEDNHAE